MTVLVNGYERLTPREVEVLRLRAAGLMHVDVARRLGASRKTVQRHQFNAQLKLQTDSMVQTVLRAVRLGYFTLEELEELEELEG